MAKSAVEHIPEPVSPTDVQTERPRAPVRVEIGANVIDGTSPSTVETITSLINRAYGHYRVSPEAVHHRMRTGRNRVLHVATREGTIVGVCSSTLYVPWW